MPIYWVSNQEAAAQTAASTWTSPLCGLGNTQTCTTAAASSTLYQVMLANQTQCTTDVWLYNQQGDFWVEQQQYYALARNRAEYYRTRTAEEQRLAEEQERQRRVQQEERNREYAAAMARSRELLLEHLTAEQRRTFEVNKWFVVEGGHTKAKYRIRTESYAGNIEVMDGKKAIARLCVHCDGVPLHDHHLAQKIALEYDEQSILRIANRTWVA